MVLGAFDGDPASLSLGHGPRPTAGRGRVVVRVEAAGISYAEVQLLRGLHPFPPRLPAVPGYDLVGRVVEVGAGVRGWAPGDRVAAMPRSGSWQEFVEVPAAILAAVPEDVDAARAVALVCNGVTAYQMAHRSARLRPGQTAFVQGATGGVGSVLTRLLVHHGVRVIGSAHPARHEVVRALGAEPVDYRSGVADAVRALAPGGVDAVFDHIGGESVSTGWRLLAPGGTLVSFDSSVDGFRSGQWFRPHLPVLRKVLGWGVAKALGLTRGRTAKTYYVRPGERFRADIAALFELVAAGVLDPAVHARYPLERVGEAVRTLMAGGVVGKLVLEP
ncbi:hypothetical protein BJP25_05975 [Actinokineospora bangkokensis]|uniref:Enoyl reductase (ER) domain-containing protein n=1 Tax=Actinokineospora bangkokensis TaxID=1193682 RepID=A0A1Q9LTX6_9PSEU|nr:hypothetical protein BJP25_05975 [Actinokineospora bangkokensis]